MSIPDELRNIRDHLRSGRFGQREVWEQQLEKAATENARLQDIVRLFKEQIKRFEAQ